MKMAQSNPPTAVGSNAGLGLAQPKRDDVASRWRVRFALPNGYFTFADIGAENGSPITKATAWAWGQREVRESKGGYSGVSSVYSIDHEA
jgi:hypothetical protein